MKEKPKTLEEIEKLPTGILTPEEVSGYLQANPNYIRLQAQQDPDKLGFPVIVQGTRVKIPKDGFVFFMRYGRPVIIEKGGGDGEPA